MAKKTILGGCTRWQESGGKEYGAWRAAPLEVGGAALRALRLEGWSIAWGIESEGRAEDFSITKGENEIFERPRL